MPRGYAILSKRGNIAAAENDYLFLPNRTDRIGKPGVIFCHGASGPDMPLRSSWPWTGILAGALAEAGIPVIAGWMGSTLTADAWANDTAMTRITAAGVSMASRAGTDPNKFHMMGLSMGGSFIARYAELNPSKVTSLTGLIGFTDTLNTYNTDTPSGLRVPIGTAWGVTYPTALPAAADILGNAALIKAAGIPGYWFHSDYDPLITVASVVAFCAASGLGKVSIDTTGSAHADGTIKQVAAWRGGSNFSQLIAFLKSVA